MAIEWIRDRIGHREPPRLISRSSVEASFIWRKDPHARVSREIPTAEIKRFSKEAREALEKEGYKIHTLTGQSIDSYRAAGINVYTSWHNKYPDFEALTSMKSEVAINPRKLTLPESKLKTFEEQRTLTDAFSHKLRKNVPGVKAVMGSAADYIDLAFTRLDDSGVYLFGDEDHYDMARTTTPAVGNNYADVGFFSVASGLTVHYSDKDLGSYHALVAPLVIPAE